MEFDIKGADLTCIGVYLPESFHLVTWPMSKSGLACVYIVYCVLVY